MEKGLVTIGQTGTCFVPERFMESLSGRQIRHFDADSASRSQLMGFMKRGGAAVLTGSWQAILRRSEEILARKGDLLPSKTDRRERSLLSRQLEERVLTILDCLPVDAADITREEMAGFLGERELPDGMPVLLPVSYAVKLLEIHNVLYEVPAIDARMACHPEVLAPQSQETIHLLCRAIDACAADLPYRPSVLDMGCGSGVLTIAACILLSERLPAVTATDILPEAVATTKFNVRRLAASGRIDPAMVSVMDAGNLFLPVRGRRFDVVLFNAPWVNARARSRLEVALNDENLQTTREFFQRCPEHLNAGGRVILGYTDNSGPEAVAKVERWSSDAGMVLQHVFKDRIKTRRSERQWQTVYAYVLRHEK